MHNHIVNIPILCYYIISSNITVYNNSIPHCHTDPLPLSLNAKVPNTQYTDAQVSTLQQIPR